MLLLNCILCPCLRTCWAEVGKPGYFPGIQKKRLCQGGHESREENIFLRKRKSRNVMIVRWCNPGKSTGLVWNNMSLVYSQCVCVCVCVCLCLCVCMCVCARHFHGAETWTVKKRQFTFADSSPSIAAVSAPSLANPAFAVGTPSVNRDTAQAHCFGSRYSRVIEGSSTPVVGSCCPNGLLPFTETCPVCGASISMVPTRSKEVLERCDGGGFASYRYFGEGLVCSGPRLFPIPSGPPALPT